MKLHWSPKSPYVRKVMICAHELGFTDQLTLVRSVAAMLSPNPEIMADNPLNKIPTLVLDDAHGGAKTLFDSRVICEYLNEQFDGALFPIERTAKWQALRWQALGDGLLDALILWRNERERTEPLAILIGAFQTKTLASLALLELEADALASSAFAIGHITLACALGYLDFRFDALNWRSHAPKLAIWFAAICTRDSLRITSPEFDA
jgi:glutathione S-transferase